MSSAWAQKIISVSNSTDQNRKELISIPFDKFSTHFSVDTVFTIKDKSSGEVYLHQIEKLGENSPKNVLIQVPINPNSKLELVVSPDKSPNYTSKTYARYVPERFDDFAWENDVVAFRIYGKALEGRKDDAQGMDYWAKRTNNLVIDKWYKTDDYHKDHGEGLDYYSVGQTLGLGDLAILQEDKIQFTQHYREFKVLDNGPLRSTFTLVYPSQNIHGEQISLTKTITLDAGSNFNKIVVDFNNENNNKTKIAIGLVRRGEENPEFEYNKKNNSLAYFEPNINDSGRTATAVVLKNQKADFTDKDSKQFIFKTTIQNNQPFTYYNGAAWDRAGKIQNFDTWKDVVKNFSLSINKPLKVNLK